MSSEQGAALHRSAEVEDLTHLTDDDKKTIRLEADKGSTSLHRSTEMEDLAHLSPQEMSKPLTTNKTTN